MVLLSLCWCKSFVKETDILLASSRHPFSIFNISLFRWTPSLPSSAMLEPLLTLASNILQPEQQPTIKALIGLQTYTTQLRDAVRVRQLDTGDKEVQGRLDKLVKSYAASGNVIARILWEADGNEGKMSSHDLHVALKQSIGSFFAVRSLLETSSCLKPPRVSDTTHIFWVPYSLPFHLTTNHSFPPFSNTVDIPSHLSRQTPPVHLLTPNCPVLLPSFREV